MEATASDQPHEPRIHGNRRNRSDFDILPKARASLAAASRASLAVKQRMPVNHWCLTPN